MTTFAQQRIERIIIMMKSLFPKKENVGGASVLIHVDNWSSSIEFQPNTIGKLFTSPQVFEQYLRHTFSENIYVIHSTSKLGVSESRNKLINTVNATYVKLSDDDDESVSMQKYMNILARHDDDICIIEGTSTFKRPNNNSDIPAVIQTCIKNDYLLSADNKYLDSIGKFSKGVVWTIIAHKSILSEIPFLPLTSFEDSFFRYMLYEYSRIKHIPYYNIGDVVYIYHGASGNANNYTKRITADDLKLYDSLYRSWCGKAINYAQMLRFVFPFIYVIPFYNKETKAFEKCNTIKDLMISIVDFPSFRCKFGNVNDIIFNQKLQKMMQSTDISDVDLYYSLITQYNIMYKFLRYVNTNPPSSTYEEMTYVNIMNKYPIENNELVLECYNKFNELRNDVVHQSSFVGDDFDFYMKYVINGNETDMVMSNVILFNLLKKPVNNMVYVKKMNRNTLI